MVSIPGSQTVSTTIGTDAARTAAVDYRGASAGVFQPDTHFDGSAVTFEVCDSLDGTYAPLYDKSGALVTVTGMVALGWYPMPVEMAGAYFFKFVFGTNQATTETTMRVTGLS